jgi:hypothetical protein
MRALSIRQPWAWLVVSGLKDIENRSWATHFRGRVLVHASKGMTRAEYDECARFARETGIIIPLAADLKRGGVIGSVDIVDCVARSDSRWFSGIWGFVLRDAAEWDFQPCVGKLGFFEIRNRSAVAVAESSEAL